MKSIESIGIADIIAIIMVVAGVIVLMGGAYGICMDTCAMTVDELILIANLLILAPTGYAFGRSLPKQKESELKDVLIETMKKD
jgi:hypothetical protein